MVSYVLADNEAMQGLIRKFSPGVVVIDEGYRVRMEFDPGEAAVGRIRWTRRPTASLKSGSYRLSEQLRFRR